MKKQKLLIGLLTVTGLGLSETYAQQNNDTVKTTTIEETVVLGSRSGARSRTESPVPVDVFNISKESVVTPQSNLNSILNSIAPSFSSTTQTAADGTDHIDPAQLRGLGPDQVLVLVNGKRRHKSALVNVNGSPGRGSVGTDLNAIPSFAVSKIEVLRDGAAAQYGSDAIAGVLNLGLKRDTGKFTGQVTLGGNVTDAANNHTGGIDGEIFQVDLNYGGKIGKRGGFYNLTWSSQFRNPTYRADEETGNIFNAYNAIEKRAYDNGVNLSSYFTNINTDVDASGLINSIHQYANQVSYFSSDFLNQIQNATTISALQSLLSTDVTDSELAARGLTRKDFNMQVGQSKANNHQLFANIEVPVSDNWKIYTFGGYSYRNGLSGGFYRKPNQSRTFTGLHINGYLPKIGSLIQDISLAAGIKGKWAGWDVDFSNTFGQNSFDYTVKNSGNSTLRFESPSEFDAGGLKFLQNTINLDFSKSFDVLEGLNVAFGGEHRYENFKISAGEEASYTTYDIYGNPITATTPSTEKVTDFFGNTVSGASQVFSGFLPGNAVNSHRNSVAAYGDVEVNFTNWFLLDGAIRYENYSDFGSTFNYKLASRIKLADDFNFRFAGSTGFRAPSLHQIYYNVTSQLYTNGEIVETGTFSNTSEIAELLGIPKLKQETSKSVSTGFTYRIPSANLTFTLDGYFIRIDDRIVLTSQFSSSSVSSEAAAVMAAAGVSAAQFFANAIDTETKGLDFVADHRTNIGNVKLTNNFALNLNQTRKVGDVHTSGLLNEANLTSTYFSEAMRIYLEEAVPRVKATLSHTATWKNFEFYLRNSYYGQTTDASTADLNGDGVKDTDEHQTIGAKIITDLSAAYQFTKQIGLTVGVNNLFDIYPTKNVTSLTNNGQFVYNRATAQFGQNGRYLFARINFAF